MSQDENKSTKVHGLVKKCLYKDEEITAGVPPDDHTYAAGIVLMYAFHPERIKAHKEEIRALLNEMPDDFHRRKGGGMSFLNLCVDKHGVHWAEHRTMDTLVCLGIAAGMASYCFPRDMWSMFPGGMPYVVFDTTEEVKDDL